MTDSYVMPTYFGKLPIAFERGKGVWLWDTEGKRYLDGLAGIAVCGLGHSHSAITASIVKQAKKLIHTSNTYTVTHQEKLAEQLARLANMDQVYFGNSGAEANEAAIKLTRMYARKKGIKEPIVVTMKNSFHGRTMATLSASGTERIQIGFEPLLPKFIYVTLNNLEELIQLSKENKDIVAVMLEPIQGDGGIRLATEDYLKGVRQLCDVNDWLMILDEVQTGVGRTGQWYCYQHTSIIPDVLTSAKSLANGLPIGVCMAKGKACNLFGPGKHGCTFGGGPLVCAVAQTVLETIEKEQLLQNAQNIGQYLMERLKDKLGNRTEVVDIRGKGLMIGVELKDNCLPITSIGLKNGLLFNVVANNVIRLLPPLIFKKSHANELVKRLGKTLDEFTAS